MKKQEPSAVTQQSHKIGRSSKKQWQREQLILAMLQQPTWQRAAAAAGISEATAWRIRQTADFQKEFLQARREVVAQSLARLQQGSSAAVATLLRIMVDPASPTASRVQAASRILDLAKSSLALEDLEFRVARAEVDGTEKMEITVTYVQQKN